MVIMSIKLKITLIIIPLFIAILVITSTISVLNTQAGLIQSGIQYFALKSKVLDQSIEEQWALLEKNGLTEEKNIF